MNAIRDRNVTDKRLTRRINCTVCTLTWPGSRFWCDSSGKAPCRPWLWGGAMLVFPNACTAHNLTLRQWRA